MKKIFLTSAIVCVSALFSIGCNTNTANNTTGKTAANGNSNVAVVVNSNSATNISVNSNIASNTSSNASSNTNKVVSSSDKDFMGKAIAGGLAELQLGGLAVQKAQNEEVRAFGQKMITDHSKANTELKTIIEQKGVNAPLTVTDEQVETMSRMGKLSGAAFDKEYVKMMIADHEKDVAEFQKEANTGTDLDTKEFAADTLPTLKMHLEMIKTIANKIK